MGADWSGADVVAELYHQESVAATVTQRVALGRDLEIGSDANELVRQATVERSNHARLD
jgi:hypothetical protein